MHIFIDFSRIVSSTIISEYQVGFFWLHWVTYRDVHVRCLFRNVISFNESKMSSFKLICPFLLASAAVYVLLLHTLCCNSKGTPNVAFVSFKILMEPMLIQKQTKPHMKAHLIESKHFMGSRGHFCFYIFTLFF